jgi:hypothetical protein
MPLDKEDIKSLIAILQKGLEDDDTNKEVSVGKSKPKAKKRITAQKKQARDNKFLSMKEKDMHKDDVLIDQKLRTLPPTERSRQYKPIKVKCVVCGKQETVSPSLMQDRSRYKCNSCSASAG